MNSSKRRLHTMHRGTLNSSRTALTTDTFAQRWSLDTTGNWHDVRSADAGSPWDLIQARTANPVNEITAITSTTGPAWPLVLESELASSSVLGLRVSNGPGFHRLWAV